MCYVCLVWFALVVSLCLRGVAVAVLFGWCCLFVSLWLLALVLVGFGCLLVVGVSVSCLLFAYFVAMYLPQKYVSSNCRKHKSLLQCQ